MRVESDDARDYYFNKCDIFHLTDFKVFEGDVFELADQACDFVMSHLSRRIGGTFPWCGRDNIRSPRTCGV